MTALRSVKEQRHRYLVVASNAGEHQRSSALTVLERVVHAMADEKTDDLVSTPLSRHH